MSRPPAKILVAILFLLALALVSYYGTVLWAGYAERTRGVALGADLPPVAFSGVPPLGINAALQDEAADQRKRSLELLKDGGYAWVRQPFPWRDVEPAKGVFVWDRWDKLVEDYLAHGLRVVAVLDRPPAWSRLDNNWPNRPPDRVSDYGDYVAAFAERYRGRVEYLQIWDEPNVFPNWGNRPVDPPGYAVLLATAYQRIKQANSSAVVLMAGLAPNGEAGGRNMSDLRFLDALYREGAAPYFDIAAAKPYGLWHHPEDRLLSDDRLNFARVVQWREVMAAQGDVAKPIWAVEFGWNALPDGWSGAASPWGFVSPADQAGLTVAAIRRARSEWPWLPVLLVQGFLPRADGADPRSGFSVVDHAGQPRPVYGALKALSSREGAGVGFHGADTHYAERQGWSRSTEGLTASPGASLRMRFTGTRLDLAVVKSPDGAVAVVTVDGEPANALLKVRGAAWLDVASKRERLERVTVAEGLPDAEHVLELKVLSRGDLWPRTAVANAEFDLAGFYVVRDPDYGWLPLLGLAVIAAATVLSWQLGLVAGPAVLAAIRFLAAALAGFARDVSVGALVALRAIVRRWRRLTDARRDVFALFAVAVALGLSYFAPLWTVPPLWMVAIFAMWGQPRAAIFALIGAAPLMRAPLTVRGAQFTPAEVLVVLAAVMLVGKALPSLSTLSLNRPRRSLQRDCYDWLANGFNAPLLLFLAASVVSTVFANQQREALRELRTVVFEPVMIYFLVLRLSPRSRAQTVEYLGRIVDALVIVGLVVALVGLFQYVFTDDVITAEGVRRLRAFYGSPNNVGLFLGRIVPLAVCLAAADRGRRWYWLALPLLVAALLLSFSIGAWLAVSAAVLFVLAFRGLRSTAFAAGGLAAMAMGLAALLPVERIAAHFNLQQGTTGSRLLLWQGAVNMLRDHLVWGVGPDNFLARYRTTYMLADAWREPDLSHPHNLLLDFWLRTGAAGMAAGLWLLARFFVVGLALYRRLDGRIERGLVLGLLASMVDFVIHGLVDNSLFLLDLALVFWLSCASLEALRRSAGGSAPGRL